MESSRGATGGSNDGQDNQNSYPMKNIHYRHSSDQTSKLEVLFKKCPSPDEHQRRQIATSLGLEPKQVKFWFQNKRTHVKTQKEREDNTTLRLENERIHNENLAILEALKNKICTSCGGLIYKDIQEREHSLKQLELENARLKEEHERVSKLFTTRVENLTPSSELELRLAPPSRSSYVPSLRNSLNLDVESASMNLDIGSTSLSVPNENKLPKPISKTIEMEKAMMLEIGIAAKEEVLKLLCTNEPLWVKSSVDRRLVLHPENYGKLFPKANHFESSKTHVESSKDSRIVKINGKQLVDIFLDSEKWTDIFSTIITRAHTIEVLERGSLENRSGTLLLMHEEMHVLSPLVPSRAFNFVRYCEQVEADVWVIVDVSYGCLKEDGPYSSTWRFPSGCVIHEISPASSQVSWIEHVEVDDKVQTHRLYRDLVNSAIAYGANRWLMELQRMCVRFTSAVVEHIPTYDSGGVINLPKGRKSVMKLSHRMVKSFCGILNMSSKMDFPQHFIEEENSGVRISFRKNNDPGLQNDMIIVTIATSLWLPLPSQNLFEFFNDPTKRVKWDVICCGNPVHEIARISNGTYPSNYISIIQPNNPTASHVMIIQESFIDPLGSYVVYSPVNISDVNMAMNGDDSSTTSILPSGVVISEDSRNSEGSTRGSLLTVAFQIIMSSPAAMNLESIASINSLITSTIQNIKDALINDSVLE